MKSLLLVMLGSGVGGGLRHLLSTWANTRFGQGFPWGTITVNVLGSFAIGYLAAMALDSGKPLSSPSARLFLTAGVCGGFTTFSTFSLQNLHLLRTEGLFKAGMNMLLSVALCLLATWVGYLLAARDNSAQ